MNENRSLIERRVEDLEDEYGRLLEMQSQLMEIERKVNELRSIMLPDALGNGGLIARMKRLERKDEQQERTVEARLKFWGPILIAVISTSGLVFREWPDIRARWSHNIDELTAPREPVKKVLHHKKKHVEVQEEEPAAD